jgi:hypothetical protein
MWKIRKIQKGRTGGSVENKLYNFMVSVEDSF